MLKIKRVELELTEFFSVSGCVTFRRIKKKVFNDYNPQTWLLPYFRMYCDFKTIC
jgi:hypothetical protein